MVRILPKATVQEKKATGVCTLDFHTLLHGKELRVGWIKAE
jgi:hypothetical protein